MSAGSFLRDSQGTAAAEMALMLPLLMVLLFGGFEIGYFLWCEHKVVEAVRNGARYASRLQVSTVCPTPSSTALTNIQRMTRTGQLASSTATPVVPGWSADTQVSVSCSTFDPSGSNTPSGIYVTYGQVGPTITVSATNLLYPSLFESLGVIDSTVHLNASASTAVIGI